ncbi:hypothetical protein MMC22_011262, partial [Lobaria immixta]|nr:hypothetical protein [Lobaria immixta]
MPSPFTSSFASAAAGNAANEPSSNGRSTGRGEGSGDWSRARTNGATQTFRRPSLATNLSNQRESAPNSVSTPGTGVYVPPHLNSSYQSNFYRNGAATESRYSKDQLLDLFRAQSRSGQSNTNVSDLYVDGWNPGSANGNNAGGWGRKDDHKDGSGGPEICWDFEGNAHPLALVEMGDEEKEAFVTSVNSPLKPPTQNNNKETPQNNGIMGRRTSLSQAQNNMSNYVGNTPSSRPGARRRESSDFLPGNHLTSPTGNNRFSRDEPHVSSPPPSLLRRTTDFKENAHGHVLSDKDEEHEKSTLSSDSTLPFGLLKRTATGPASAGVTGSPSPWSGGPQSAGFTPMGAFGNFSLGGTSTQPLTPGEKKSAFGASRGESRFKGLMNSENSEDAKSKIKEKASSNSLEQLAEASSEQPPTSWSASRTAHRRESKTYQDHEKYGAGSAALGGDDPSPPSHHSSRARNPDRQMSYDDIGFSSLGPSGDIPPFRELMQRRDFSQNTPQAQIQNTLQMNEPMSPTNTNPYQSPEAEKAVPEDFDTDDSDPHNSHFAGTRHFSHHARGLQSQHEGTASDRSQTSSAGASRPFPSLGSLGGLSGIGPTTAWSNAPGAIGTPTRALPGYSAPFGDSIFSPLGDISSPGYNTSGPSSGFLGGIPSSATSSAAPIGRGSKMGSLFPNAMQEQMREPSRQDQGLGETSDLYQRNPTSANAPGFGAGLRDTDSPVRAGRGMLDDLFSNYEVRNRNAVTTTFPMNETSQVTSSQAPTSISSQAPYSAATTFAGTPSMAATTGASYFSRSQDQDSSASVSNQMPATQQRQMVMPDRMRWIYRDPQGNTQGPWSGLEMHDWYKAGFFSPELQVKKLEDADYEPLAQLIRRIGNSREPFLVPQIGIPHGSAVAAPSSSASATGAIPATTPSAIQASSAQPPFASSFPSFGTTLTAEQQNALERRKQEEQYLMARQKEHLAQQQVMIKQMQHMQGGTHGLHSQQLHHHSSAHSLQSQPSYGSITSPTGYQPSPAQGPIQPPAVVSGFFDAIPRNTGPSLGPLGGSSETLSSVREDELPGIMDRMNTGRTAQQPLSGPTYPVSQQEGLNHSQQVAAMLQERTRIQREQEHFDMLQRNSDDLRGTTDRLEQFHLLRTQVDEPQQYPQPGHPASHAARPSSDADFSAQQHGQDESTDFEEPSQVISMTQKGPEHLSLSEQVQKAAAMAKQAPTTQPQSPWAKVEAGLPQPFPPPQSSSPLPAPAAQRNRQNVADALTAESRSRSQTPIVDTPTAAMAPWAKDSTDSSKGQSIKEILAMESKKAAQQEEVAAAARRAIAEQERQNQSQSQPIAAAPGLPSSANWASGVSPAIPISSGPSVWTKAGTGKAPVSTTSTNAKRTMAQIQKEEEARKNRAAATAAASAASNASVSAIAGGKRYADFASKAALSTPQVANTAWTTVGAGGKVKTPTGPAPVLNPKPVGSATSQPPASAPKPKVSVPTRVPQGGSVSGQQAAMDELAKWTKSSLGKGLNSGIPVDDFISQLLILPAEIEIISDSIYASSQTLDGRRFAEEFVRRRKLADKGIIPDASGGMGMPGFSPGSGNAGAEGKGGNGGWSEVAKKGPTGGGAAGGKEGERENFRVVAGKKK